MLPLTAAAVVSLLPPPALLPPLLPLLRQGRKRDFREPVPDRDGVSAARVRATVRICEGGC